MTTRFRWGFLLVALALLLRPTPAFADARDDARRAFRQGMELIDQGQHLEGAERLERAYEILPHPSVLYNIGLAYSDGGDFVTAIAYFERYLASEPEDGAAVERLIQLLRREARVGVDVASGSPGEQPAEQPEVPGDSGPKIVQGAQPVAVAGPEVEALILRLEKLADRLEKGEITTRQAAPVEELGELGDIEDALTAKAGDIYEEVVVSASRQATSPADAPAATTIISAEEIRLSGATNLPDLLRRVPGLSILTMSSGNANIAIRGFNQRLSNKVLVLIDGRSVYLDFLAGTFFRTFAYDIQDIERIEIVRGPGATLYGAGAFGGVINIITKPITQNEGEVHITGGSGETLRGNVQFAGRKDQFGWRGSLSYEQTDRYSLDYGERSDFQFNSTDPTLGVRTVRANGAFQWTPTRNASIRLSGGGIYSFDNFFAIGLFRDFFIEGGGAHARADVRLGGLGVRVFWNYFDTDADQSFAPVGAPSLATAPVSHVIDVEASYSATATLGVQHDLTVGAGYRVKTIDWSYLDDKHVEQHLNGFVEDRITFVPQLVAVLGFRFDQHPLVGFTPSPRAAVLIKPTPRQGIRISAGTAFRNPSFLESYLDLVVPGPVSAVGIQSFGNTELAPENIFSVEAGWVFEESDYLNFEIAGYYERVTDFIQLGAVQPPSELKGLQGNQFIAGTSQFENTDTEYHGLGLEAGVHAFPVDGLDLRANYSFSYFIDQEKLDAELEDVRDKRHPQHLFNFGASYRAPFGLDANVDVHVVSAIDLPERTFDSAGNVLVESCSADMYAMVNARVGYRLLKDKLEFGLTVFNIPGLVTGGHREHCFGQRVGGRVLGSATYRF